MTMYSSSGWVSFACIKIFLIQFLKVTLFSWLTHFNFFISQRKSHWKATPSPQFSIQGIFILLVIQDSTLICFLHFLSTVSCQILSTLPRTQLMYLSPPIKHSFLDAFLYFSQYFKRRGNFSICCLLGLSPEKGDVANPLRTPVPGSSSVKEEWLVWWVRGHFWGAHFIYGPSDHAWTPLFLFCFLDLWALGHLLGFPGFICQFTHTVCLFPCSYVSTCI